MRPGLFVRRCLSSSGTDRGLVRLNKLLADRKLASRREADALIKKGAVRVDGVVVHTLGSKVRAEARVEVERKILPSATFAIHKPRSFISQATNPRPGQRYAWTLLRWGNQIAECSYRGVEVGPAPPTAASSLSASIRPTLLTSPILLATEASQAGLLRKARHGFVRSAALQPRRGPGKAGNRRRLESAETLSSRRGGPVWILHVPPESSGSAGSTPFWHGTRRQAVEACKCRLVRSEP